jgi:CrcB protein
MLAYLWVAIGGALGSVGRFWISGLVAEASTQRGSIFPWNTLVVNISGSLVIGFVEALTAPGTGRFAAPGVREFVMVGVCGGYTTFSAFSLQTLNLLQDREWGYAAANALLSLALCMAAVWLGYVLGSVLNSAKGS